MYSGENVDRASTCGENTDSDGILFLNLVKIRSGRFFREHFIMGEDG